MWTFFLVDGNWSGWGPYSKCNPIRMPSLMTPNLSALLRAFPCWGIQKRLRTCTDPAPSNGGMQCPGPNYEYKKCPLDCKGEWIQLIDGVPRIILFQRNHFFKVGQETHYIHVTDAPIHDNIAKWRNYHTVYIHCWDVFLMIFSWRCMGWLEFIHTMLNKLWYWYAKTSTRM